MPAPETPPRVAGSEQVKDWKTKLKPTMSVMDLTSSVIAVAAPLLSATAADLSKIAFGQ